MNAYSFGILEPIKEVLKEKKHDYLWYVEDRIKEVFPFKNEPVTSKVTTLVSYKSDAIFVPGNEVPHYLRGLKVQVFHGLAGEKKGHFRIRHYFDVYLTQGPYFTRKFIEFKNKFKNFEVVETGWPKLDVYGKKRHAYEADKQVLLEKFTAKKIVLYAPTFSPSLTSAPFLLEEIRELSENKDYLILIKFHDLMSSELIESYKKLANETDTIVYENERNIIKFLLMADLMISDTSSVVYEFLLLDKPVITFKNNSKNIQWDNSLSYTDLSIKVKENLEQDNFKEEREKIASEYHPYNDGNSALRMVETVEQLIAKNGVPNYRKLPWLRRRKMNTMFGKI